MFSLKIANNYTYIVAIQIKCCFHHHFITRNENVETPTMDAGADLSTMPFLVLKSARSSISTFETLNTFKVPVIKITKISESNLFVAITG